MPEKRISTVTNDAGEPMLVIQTNEGVNPPTSGTPGYGPGCLLMISNVAGRMSDWCLWVNAGTYESCGFERVLTMT